MAKEYIERDEALNAIERSIWAEYAYDRVEQLPAADVVEVVERTSEIDAALDALNFYRNRFYNEPSGTERHEIANAINTILPLICKCLKGR